MADEIASGKDWLREQERPTEWGVPFTYEGIERSNEPMWSAQIPRSTRGGRITLSGAEIANSRHQEGTFQRAVRDEWDRIIRDMRYAQGQQWVSWGETLDPDMEMDIGL